MSGVPANRSWAVSALIGRQEAAPESRDAAMLFVEPVPQGA